MLVFLPAQQKHSWECQEPFILYPENSTFLIKLTSKSNVYKLRCSSDLMETHTLLIFLYAFAQMSSNPWLILCNSFLQVFISLHLLIFSHCAVRWDWSELWPQATVWDSDNVQIMNSNVLFSYSSLSGPERDSGPCIPPRTTSWGHVHVLVCKGLSWI